ncbi:hypothetical protein ACM39_12100 [Chryseobacterium sp. FH2]|uniref:GLPGLI family protein n=1 Tax=Chryseobacterium sp. FH2 TaxID=1674291 RepID=UPI00065AD2C4|nr:GLPGLI family protein [Chryseobacterium sp. FH2]KMQ67599.1 hypothetical protein ACM39_12100 [Chryseobacterium sp. FH2]
MKKNIFLYFLLIYGFYFGQNKINVDSSYIICKYHTVFLTDTADITTKKEEIMTLQIGKNTSLFKSDQKYIADSLREKAVDEGLKNVVGNNIIIDGRKIPKANFFQEVYIKDGKVRIYDKVFDFVYEFEPVNKMQWALLNETKVISNYNCKKATGIYGNRKWVAWYTDEITISEGPYNFKGLPGLIVEIYDEKDFYHFTLNYLKKSKTPINIPDFSIQTTFAKFDEKRKDFRENPLPYVNQIMHNPISIDKNQQENIKRNIRRRNNYLD